MTDDEPFIQAVLAAPGDDAPRLVYADWLDERADPRGAYLRAAVQSRAARKRPPKVGKLDAVWAARVGRPPAGVCCPHLALSSTGGNDPADIDAVEAEVGVQLPPQLRALLLNFSLGRLKGGPFILPRGADGRRMAITEIVCLTDPDWNDGHVSTELTDRTQWLRDEYELGPKFLFLASTTDDTEFVISGRRSDRGAVYQTDGEQMLDEPGTGLERIARSLGEFLALLEPRTWPLTTESGEYD